MNLFAVGAVTSSTLLFIIIISILWILLVYISYKTYGFKPTLRLFLPMMIAALFLEAAAVANGRYSYQGYLLSINVFQGSVPVIILMGWGVNLFLFMHLGDRLVHPWYKHYNYFRYILVALVASISGVFLDFFEDPLAHHNQWWIWREASVPIEIFNVPLTNYVDWFLIMFFFTLITQIIHQSPLTENRKLIVAITTVPLLGGIIYALHHLFLYLLQLF